MAATLPHPGTSSVLDRVKNFAGREHRLFIDGAWIPAASGQTFDVFDPATGALIGRAPAGDIEDVDRAVRAARRAFESGPWRALLC